MQKDGSQSTVCLDASPNPELQKLLKEVSKIIHCISYSCVSVVSQFVGSVTST